MRYFLSPVSVWEIQIKQQIGKLKLDISIDKLLFLFAFFSSLYLFNIWIEVTQKAKRFYFICLFFVKVSFCYY